MTDNHYIDTINSSIYISKFTYLIVVFICDLSYLVKHLLVFKYFVLKFTQDRGQYNIYQYENQYYYLKYFIEVLYHK